MRFTTNNQRVLNVLFSKEFSDAKEYKDEDTYFEFFAAKQIMKQFDLSDEEVENGICGGTEDGGCDAMYILLNNSIITEDALEEIKLNKNPQIDIIIVQSKKESGCKEDALLKWKTTVKNLLEFDTDKSKYKNRYSEDVISTFTTFCKLYDKALRQNPLLNIHFYHASFAPSVHPNVYSQAEELKETVREMYPSSKVFVNFWGADEILTAAQSPTEHKLNLHLAEIPISASERHNYVALVKLVDYYDFISNKDNSLRSYIFEANVRDYQGHNNVNQEIEKTLDQKTDEDFWWLNNGITLLTDEAILVTNKEFSLTEPVIVNGLQTSTEIFRYFRDNPSKKDTEDRNILIRVIVPESEESRDRIILATNNQTSIPKSSLRANDPIHRQIELYFKGKDLYYDRRKNYYKNQGKKSVEIISVSFLAQCMISLLLQKPDYARARPSTLLTKDDTYNSLYVKNTDLDVFYNAAKLGRTIDSILKKSGKYSQAQKNDIVFYVLYVAVAQKIQKTKICASDIKKLDLSSFTDQYILQVADTVFTAYSQLGGNSKVAKGSVLVTQLQTQISQQYNHKNNQSQSSL